MAVLYDASKPAVQAEAALEQFREIANDLSGKQNDAK
jgi:hypothetical protein